jgi:hypothetical protein
MPHYFILFTATRTQTVDHERLKQLDELLKLGLESLDLSEAQHNDAVAKYQAVGQWLDADDSLLASYDPTIYAQGSMATGTTNKIIGQDERDIDLVCEMRLPESVMQAEAKRLLGQRLKESKVYSTMLEEKNRCWRLVYAGEFHMDLLPAKPDGRTTTSSALLIPDKSLQSWKETDPKGFALWFLRKAVQSMQVMREASVRILAGVEPVPKYVPVWDKAPLQIAVQILKRHRDESMNGNDDAPISIIITTLAAHAYRGHESVYATLLDLLDRMPKHIEYDPNGRPYVRNPMNRLENFADKWHSEPQKHAVFNEWVAQATSDLQTLASSALRDAFEPLSKFLGERHAGHAIREYGNRMQQYRKRGLRVATATGTLGAAGGQSAEVRPNTFYGANSRG